MKGAPALEEDVAHDDEQALSERMASVKLVYDDNKKSSDDSERIPPKETISAVEYLKQICVSKLTAHFQKEYDTMKEVTRKTKLDSKDNDNFVHFQLAFSFFSFS